MGQCTDLSLLDCDCGSTIGIDRSEAGCCNYFTRGKPEYRDFCQDCPSPEYYVSVFGGASFAENLLREQPTLAVNFLGASLEESVLAGGSIGRQWNSRLRTELEFAFRRNESETWFERATVGNVVQTLSEVPAIGLIERYNGMANITFDLVPRRVQHPNIYAGAGAGVSYGKGVITTATDVFSLDDPSFTWQWIVGVNFAARPGLDLFTEYRYVQAENFDVLNTTLGQSLGDFELDSHDVIVGLRFRR